MTLDDMKNKISMALQNSIEQLAFEIICKQLDEKDKQIEELNKTNTETLSELNHINGDLIIKLEKAKEIIEEFMITETCGVGYSELYDKAEQFLKEK